MLIAGANVQGGGTGSESEREPMQKHVQLFRDGGTKSGI